MVRFFAYALVVFSAGGCGIFVQDGPWDLSVGVGVAGQPLDSDVNILFPDAQSLGNSSDLELWALEIQGVKCQDLVDGYLDPDPDSMLRKMSTTLPASQGALIRALPDRQVMFFARASDSVSRVLLRACTTARARKKQGITLDMVCVCQPVPGICAAQDEKAGNDIDDDCDGLTDECTDGQDCDDDNGCTQDICVEGICQNSKLPDNVPCSDGDLCTLDDKCLDGECKGEPKDCSDHDGTCLLGICDKETGACESLPAQDGVSCDDGLKCTVEDACFEGQCRGQVRDCSDDDDVCTEDSCDEQHGCTHVLVPRPGMEGPAGHANCSNGQDDDCDGRTDLDDSNCKSCNQDSDCDDDNECTQDSCSDNQCKNTPISDAFCHDGLYCNGDDTCLNGACQVHSGDPCANSASDGDPDCSESCDEETDSCVAHDPDGSPCDDGLFCTDNDQCKSGQCTGVEHDCSDNDHCTIDTCDEDGDQCVNEPDPDPGTEGPIGDASCFNEMDDDCDGDIDLHDYDCFECSSSEGTNGDPSCTNGVDDDCDGKTDGQDDDCWSASQCSFGNAQYSNQNEYVVDSLPKDIVAADFNNDQHLDVVTCHGDRDAVIIRLGNGDGTVGDAKSSTTGDFPYSVKAADFDSDGKMDLATANYNSNNISILLGNGDGTFSPHQDYYSGPLHDTDPGDHPRSLVVSDFNGDLVPDLAVANKKSDSIGILLGQGDGGFSAPVVVPLIDYTDGDQVAPSALVAVDMNKDGVMDLAYISSEYSNDNGHVTILLGGSTGGHWDGTFGDASNFTIDRSTYSMVASDFNSDGLTDFAITHTYDVNGAPDVTIMMGQGSGGIWDGTFSFKPFSAQYRDVPRYIAVGYFDSDCMVDLAVSAQSVDNVRIYHGNGDGTFAETYLYYPHLESPGVLTSADFNADGANDFAVAGNNSSGDVYLNISLGDLQQRTLPVAADKNTKAHMSRKHSRGQTR